jgi:DNA-binding protein Fis
VLNHTRWQKKRASEILGINASTLYRKLLGTD